MNDQDSADRPLHALQDPAPLGIRHLLVWTACSAAYLAVSRAVFKWEEAEVAHSYVGFSAAASLGAGAALGGLIMFFSCLRRRVRFPAHPGETLLVVFGIRTLAHVSNMVQYGLWEHGRRWVDIPLASCMLLTGLLGLIAWVWLLVATIRAPSRRWRLLFLLLLLEPVLRMVEMTKLLGLAVDGSGMILISRVLPAGRVLLKGVFLGMVAAAEWRRQPRRPWTHWAGILCCAWGTLLEFAGMIATWIRFGL